MNPLTTPVTAWASPLVMEALSAVLHIRCDGTVHETAWRCAMSFCRRWTFESSYQHAAWQALSTALAAGDSVGAERAAEWIVRPDDAMERALAEVRAEAAAKAARREVLCEECGVNPRASSSGVALHPRTCEACDDRRVCALPADGYSVARVCS